MGFQRSSLMDQYRGADPRSNDGYISYFDKKMQLKKSIEQKLHYDHKKLGINAPGGYQTNTQKHLQKVHEFKNIKKQEQMKSQLRHDSMQQSNESFKQESSNLGKSMTPPKDRTPVKLKNIKQSGLGASKQYVNKQIH